MSTAVQQHITFDKHGRAVIAGTRWRVAQIAELVKTGKWSAARIHRSYDGLSLAQIHAALSYYYDHQAAVDAEIEREDREAEELLKTLTNPALQAKLRELKRQAGKSRARQRKLAAGK